jgi:hypothetical protein
MMNQILRSVRKNIGARFKAVMTAAFITALEKEASLGKEAVQ